MEREGVAQRLSDYTGGGSTIIYLLCLLIGFILKNSFYSTNLRLGFPRGYDAYPRFFFNRHGVSDFVFPFLVSF